MKKLFLFSLLMIMSVCCIFGQVDSKKLLTATHSFVTEQSEDWEIVDGNFTYIDTIGEEYTFSGGFIVKILVGSSRYDFTCTVKNDGDDFTVTIPEMQSYACDKNGKIIKNGTIMKTSSKVAEQYAAQMKDEITKRMNAISDVEASFTKVATSPEVLDILPQSMSELAVKKFVEKNVNGKTVELDIILDSIDENENTLYGETKNLSYKVVGHIANKKYINLHNIFIYSNNDKLLSSKIGSTYKAKGTVKFYQNLYWYYQISEE